MDELVTEIQLSSSVVGKTVGQLGFEPRASTLSEWRST